MGRKIDKKDNKLDVQLAILRNRNSFLEDEIKRLEAKNNELFEENCRLLDR